jgi:hypothetical protein
MAKNEFTQGKMDLFGHILSKERWGMTLKSCKS